MLNNIKLKWKRFNYWKAFQRIKTPQELFRACMLHGLYITQFDKNQNDLAGNFYTFDLALEPFKQYSTMCTVIGDLSSAGWIDIDLYNRSRDEIYDFMRSVSEWHGGYMHVAIRQATKKPPACRWGVLSEEHEEYVSKCIKKLYHHWDDRYELIEGMKHQYSA